MKSFKKILVCGGRYYNNAKFVEFILNSALRDFGEICIIQGGAKGADLLAKQWAKAKGVACITVEANWDYYGKSAGFKRNTWMAVYCAPDMCLAFDGGNGTADMVKKAKLCNIETYEVKENV